MKRVENQRGRDRDRPDDADDGVFSLAAKDELLVVEIERFGFRFNRVGDRGFGLAPEGQGRRPRPARLRAARDLGLQKHHR